MSIDEKPPWKRRNPRKRATKMTAEEKATARAMAQRAGRRYPNLVDNMRVIAARKQAPKKKVASKRSRSGD